MQDKMTKDEEREQSFGTMDEGKEKYRRTDLQWPLSRSRRDTDFSLLSHRI